MRNVPRHSGVRVRLDYLVFLEMMIEFASLSSVPHCLGDHFFLVGTALEDCRPVFGVYHLGRLLGLLRRPTLVGR